MLQRAALGVLLLLISAATAIFAAGYFGVRLPWEIAATDDAPPVAAAPKAAEPRDPSATAADAPPSRDRDRDPAASAEQPAASAESQQAAVSPDAATSAVADTAAALGAGEAPADSAPGTISIDISRISPDGPSVFAGRAEPGRYVTVFEDGKPAGTVKADADGAWSLATEHKFASADPKLTYEASDLPPPAPEPPPAPAVATAEPAAPTAASVASDVMRKFEKLVADARTEAARQRETAAAEAANADDGAAGDAPTSAPPTDTAAVPPESAPASATAPAATEKTAETQTVAVATPQPAPPAAPPAPPQTTHTEATGTQQAETTSATSETAPARATAPTAAAASSATAAAAPAGARIAANTPADPEIIPVPIMFVYNEATLTGEGQRAADLLLEYLLLKRLGAVELTGHADERGTNEYNFELSRERLETVSRILRAGGYAGDLKLTPKGKMEPYMGVDRSAYRGEALYQLDRRVELRISR